MLEMPSSQLLDERYDLEYVGEGAANVVFKLISLTSDCDSTRLYPTSGRGHFTQISLPQVGPLAHLNDLIPPTTPTSPRRISVHNDFPQRGNLPIYRARPPDRELPLLRLRKDLDTVSSIEEAHRNYQEKILPHLSAEHLIESDLAAMPQGLVMRCNALLQRLEMEGERPKSRRNVYLADQRLANLVQDMSPRNRFDVVMEFKPKWLAQSPSAPSGSKRCRTCALRAMRCGGSTEGAEHAFCPLDLTKDRSTLQAILATNLRSTWKPKRSSKEIKIISKAVARYLMESHILEKVKQLQETMDPIGILDGRVDDNFLMAMTLRDCTLFVRVNLSAGGEADLAVEARLGDIDLKPDTKKSYWRRLEERLRDEKWYTCGEVGGSGRDKVCALSR